MQYALVYAVYRTVRTYEYTVLYSAYTVGTSTLQHSASTAASPFFNAVDTLHLEVKRLEGGGGENHLMRLWHFGNEKSYVLVQ